MDKSLKINCSYICRRDSQWLKGLLTFLIILGHNMTFTISFERYGVMSYLYTFHVQCFFILPFLYGSSPLTISAVKKQLSRFYWPFFVISTVLMIFYSGMLRFANFSGTGLLRMYLCCDAVSLKQMCGYKALWFLPAMMWTLLLKDFFYYTSKWVQAIIMLLSVLIELYAFATYIYSFPPIPDYLFVPINSLHFLLLGVIIRWIFSRCRSWNPAIVFAFASLLFVSGTIIYVFKCAMTIQTGENIWFKVLQLWMPLAFMLMMCKSFELKSTSDDSLFYKFGQESLPIYIVSPFLGYAGYFVMHRLGMVYWWTGVSMQFIIVFCSYLISVLVFRGRFRQFLFPKNYGEFRRIFSRNKAEACENK